MASNKLTKAETEDPQIPKSSDFDTIDAADLLLTARNRLRGLETDYASNQMVPEMGDNGMQAWREERIADLKNKIIPALEKQARAEEPEDEEG